MLLIFCVNGIELSIIGDYCVKIGKFGQGRWLAGFCVGWK